MSKKLKITQVRSTIGRLENQKTTMRALGIRKLHMSVTQPNNPQIRGMIERVKHLVKVEEVDGE